MLYRPHILENLLWAVGDGSHTNPFQDRWILDHDAGPRTQRRLPHLGSSTPPATVSHLICPDWNEHLCWNKEALQLWWDEDMVAYNLTTPLGGHDIPCWGSENAGTCPMKALYHYFTQSSVGPHMPWTKYGLGLYL